MANTKNYGLIGVGTELEFGPDGPKIVNNGGLLELRTNDGTSLVRLKSANPQVDDDVVTKGYMERTVNVNVTGQINGGSPPAVVNGAIYMCTTTGGVYTQNYLYRGESGSWVEIVPFNGMRIAVTTDLTGGAVTFNGDDVYLWDLEGTQWIDIGPYVAPTKFTKSERANLVFNSAGTINIGAACPVNGRPFTVVINVTQAFNGVPRSRVTVGDAGSTNRLAQQNDSNLNTVGIYLSNCYYNYGVATQMTATYTANGATQGAAQIEVLYTTD